jgi:DNA-directed RNA polymerase subunit RPC12/RpoP
MRLIDADRLDWWYKGRPIRRVIDEAPTIDAEPIINAFWKKRIEHGAYWYACSNCDEHVPKNRYGYDYFSRRCPNCGAKMDFERKDTDE